MQMGMLLILMTMKTILSCVLGSFHQGDPRFFDVDTLGRQCVANCVVARIYATQVPFHRWSQETLDTVLIAGNEEYKRVKKHEPYLLLTDFQGVVQCQGKRYKLTTGTERYGCIDDQTHAVEGGSTLRESIVHCATENTHSFALLNFGSGSNGEAMLLALNKRTYCYIFDSHSRNQLGKCVPDGRSVLLKCHSLNAMIQHLEIEAHARNHKCFDLTLFDVFEGSHYLSHLFAQQHDFTQGGVP